MTEIDGIEIGIGLDFSELDDGLKSLDTRLRGAAGSLDKSIGGLAAGSLTRALDQLLKSLVGQLLGGVGRLFGGGGATSGFVLDAVAGLFAGFASGGAVAGGIPVVVGERGPELFVPQAPGLIVPHQQAIAAQAAHSTQITIHVQGAGSPEAMRQSAGQIALAVRRAVDRAGRDL